jgi:hypothetical protein
MDKEKKIFYSSIIIIVSIVFIVGIINNISININQKNILGKAIQEKNINYEIANNTSNKRIVSNLSLLSINSRKCEAICPFGSNVINASCKKINETCNGNVICGFYQNETLINITNGNCALLNVIPDAR